MTEYRTLLRRQRAYYQSGRTRSYGSRMKSLDRMYRWIEVHEKEIEEALRADLGKAAFEAYATEIGIVKEEIRFHQKHLCHYMKIKKVKTPITQFPASSFIYPEPYGVVLIMSPWNYPFQLTIAPLAAALAAGNCAIVKPSAYAACTSELLKQMIGELFPKSYVCAVTGGRAENEMLLEEKFDYIFFTGSSSVGRYVMEKAARHLTPVSLELGGKSPCIVDESADIRLAARRIVWGKFLNAGQTCVAPDYLLVHHKVKERLVKAICSEIKRAYGANPLESPDYPHIINEKHFNRLCGLLREGRLLTGGEVREKTLQIAPALVDQVSWDAAVMQEEIFGPILPIIVFYNVKEVIDSVRSRPKPLALYLFTKKRSVEKEILKNLSFGGGCINDTVVHLATSHLPFGGVGESGMGSYHGQAGFDTFTHKKSIMKKSLIVDVPVRYAPYRKKLWIVKKLMR